MDFIKEVLLPVILIVAGLFFIIGFPLYQVDKSACYRSFPEFEKKYDFWIGCQINTDKSGWIPTDNYRDIK